MPDRVGSYLFRIEVHHVDYDNGGLPTGVVLKWSRENGAEAAAIGSEPPGFVASDWTYDFYHGAGHRAESECHLGYHAPAALATGWEPTRSELVQGFPDAPPAGFDLVRRWDGYVELAKDGADLARRLSPRRLRCRCTTALTAASACHPCGRPMNTAMSARARRCCSRSTPPWSPWTWPTMSILAGDFWHVAVREAVHAPGDEIRPTRPRSASATAIWGWHLSTTPPSRPTPATTAGAISSHR